MPNNLLQNILSDLRVDLTDHFDKNFSRGGFFGKKWKPRKDGVATHLNNTGTLSRSISAKVHGHSLTFTSSTPYSAIHNEGGIIRVSEHIRTYRVKVNNGKLEKRKRLIKAYNYEMPQRQYLGAYPGIDKTIDRAARRAIDDELKRIAQSAKR